MKSRNEDIEFGIRVLDYYSKFCSGFKEANYYELLGLKKDLSAKENRKIISELGLFRVFNPRVQLPDFYNGEEIVNKKHFLAVCEVVKSLRYKFLCDKNKSLSDDRMEEKNKDDMNIAIYAIDAAISYLSYNYSFCHSRKAFNSLIDYDDHSLFKTENPVFDMGFNMGRGLVFNTMLSRCPLNESALNTDQIVFNYFADYFEKNGYSMKVSSYITNVCNDTYNNHNDEYCSEALSFFLKNGDTRYFLNTDGSRDKLSDYAATVEIDDIVLIIRTILAKKSVEHESTLNYDDIIDANIDDLSFMYINTFIRQKFISDILQKTQGSNIKAV